MNRAFHRAKLLLLLVGPTAVSFDARGGPSFDDSLPGMPVAPMQPTAVPVDNVVRPVYQEIHSSRAIVSESSPAAAQSFSVVSSPAPESAPAGFDAPASPAEESSPAIVPAPANELPPHQFVTPGAPSSPAQFSPDSGVRPGTLQPEVAPQPGIAQKVEVIPTAPDTPGAFNPDPGAQLRPPVTNAPPFYKSEIPPAPQFSGQPVPADLALPRANVRRDEVIVTNAPPGDYGSAPLPSGLELPRENTRANAYLKEKWENPEYPVENNGYNFPPDSEPMTNRWRIGFTPWKRYTSASVEQPYETPQPLLWRPYRQSVLKGDAPIIGQDIFLNLTAESTTEVEARRIPTPSGVSASQFSDAEFYGRSESYALQQNFAFSLELFKGETVFQPVHWRLKFEPVVNYNYTYFNETGILNPDTSGGGSGGGGGGGLFPPLTPVGDLSGHSHTTRSDYAIALQQAFLEVHLGDLSENYDFFALKIGNQPFISDFRGFIFNDVDLGARLFGNWDNNRWQYNLAVFDMNEKDSNSDLNTFDRRDQRVVIANLYKQDFIWKGYTVEASVHADLDDGGTHYDDNGFLVRPEPLGTVVPHSVDAYYLGFAGDGHIGRWNVSHAFYEVLGRDDYNGLAGRAVDINAQMAALELSYDRDWIRYKASLFYGSGDDKPTDGTATGFDSILDNPNFTGGPFSWYAHQGFNLGGTQVGLKPRNSLFPDLRSSKSEGQANFVNPGVFIVGLGTEMDLTPKLRGFLNANYIRFMETAPIETALLTPHVDNELGWDLSLGLQYRPALTDNIIISAGFGVLIPGQGYRDIYRTATTPVPGYSTGGSGRVDDFLYSAILAVTLKY